MEEKLLSTKKNGMVMLLLTALLYLAAVVLLIAAAGGAFRGPELYNPYTFYYESGYNYTAFVLIPCLIWLVLGWILFLGLKVLKRWC